MIFLVTGGRGFIGSHFVEEALDRGHKVIDIDKMTYAANSVLPWDNHKNYKHINQDICSIDRLPQSDVLINFAAESHVDNSIRDTQPFIQSNFIGVHNLLELLRGKPKYDRPLFFHISTDEVYGDTLESSFVETDRLKPSNPYSASKASAEMLILSYHRTYDVDYIISRSANNYGPRQYEEKLIPKSLFCIKNGKKIPIHGDGSYIRDWTYVKDNVSGIFCLLDSQVKNQTFNIAAENHLTNLEVVDTVLSWYNLDREQIQFVPNRWGQDLRYSISAKKLRDLGWTPKYTKGIKKWF
jgi:dTDP-glucose 4,6-dehydratase